MTDTTRRTRLLERGGELEQIGRSLDDAVEGRGGTVVLEGAAGIGKSSLLDAAVDLADARGMTLLHARSAAMEREFALGVVLQLLAPHIEPLTGGERDRVFAGAAGLARPLFEEVPDRAAAEGRLFARFHGLHWLCARLGEQRPLALLVDDAHWADGHSLRFLAYLAARIEEIPGCAIVAVRTGEEAAVPAALAELCELGREPVRPAALSPDAVAVLARDRLGEGTADEVCAECARTTGGNPLLVRHLIDAIGQRGVDHASLDAGTIAAMGPPPVAQLVSARLRRQPAAVGAVARGLAILGEDASMADLAEVCEV